MGYQHGLTLQALPYDFRYGILASSTPKLLPQIINNLYYTTGKKVVIVAHSLGTLHTLMDLAYFVPQAQKDMMVRHYIPITPPWFGTVSAIRNVLYGDASYF
jgi:triacylglycerol esterase/lipase EstA (alpha/beta hydrolase family)